MSGAFGCCGDKPEESKKRPAKRPRTSAAGFERVSYSSERGEGRWIAVVRDYTTGKQHKGHELPLVYAALEADLLCLKYNQSPVNYPTLTREEKSARLKDFYDRADEHLRNETNRFHNNVAMENCEEVARRYVTYCEVCERLKAFEAAVAWKAEATVARRAEAARKAEAAVAAGKSEAAVAARKAEAAVAARKAEAALAARKAEAAVAARCKAIAQEAKQLSVEELEARAENARALQAEARRREDWVNFRHAGKYLREFEAALLRARRKAKREEQRAAKERREAEAARSKAKPKKRGRARSKAKDPFNARDKVLQNVDFDQYDPAYAAAAKVVRESGSNAAMKEYRKGSTKRAREKRRAEGSHCSRRPPHCRALALCIMPWKLVGIGRSRGGSVPTAVSQFGMYSTIIDVELHLTADGCWQGRYVLSPRGGGLKPIPFDVVQNFIGRIDDDGDDDLPRASASSSSSPSVLDWRHCGYSAAHALLAWQRRNGELVPPQESRRIVEMAVILDVATSTNAERSSMTTVDCMLVSQDLMHAVAVPTGPSADVERQLRTWHEGQGGLPASQDIQAILANELNKDQVKACVLENISSATQQQQCVPGQSTTLWYQKSEERNVLFVDGKPGPAFHRLPLKLQGHIAAVHLECGGVDKGRIQITLRAPGAESEKHTLGWHFDTFRKNGKFRDITIYSIKLSKKEYDDLWSIGKGRPAGRGGGGGKFYTGIMDAAESEHATNCKKDVLRTRR